MILPVRGGTVAASDVTVSCRACTTLALKGLIATHFRESFN